MADEAARRQSRTPRIGVVSLLLGADSYERAVAGGVVDAVRTRGGSVACFAVEAVGKDFASFVGQGTVDAFVILSGPLMHAFGREALDAFCRRWRHVPLVSVGAHLDGVTTVRADGRGGIRKAIAHLVDVHGRRRIGFIRGPETTLAVHERFVGYEEALAENGIAPHAEWVASSAADDGAAAIRELFDERKQDLEAVVTYNDTAALAALGALVDRGVRVPHDVAIVGYHDIPEVDQVIPPITTVNQKLYEQGWRAANLVLAALEGKVAPEEVVLDTELVIRRSCGCFPPRVLHSSSELPSPDPRRIDERRSEIAVEMTRVLGLGEAHSSERLLAAFISDLNGSGAHRFLSTLDERLNRMARLGEDLSRWEEAISIMRRLSLVSLGDGERRLFAENLWHEARVLVGDAAQRAQAYQRMLDRQRASSLGRISQSLIAAKDLDELFDVLARGLPELGVRSCYVSLYDGAAGSHFSTLVLGIEEGGVKSAQVGTRFAAERLAPAGVLRQEPGRVVVVVPLSFKGEQLGMILLETDPTEPASYDQLRGQFGAAFKRMEGERELARLHGMQRERVLELERAHRALRENQEKLLISERMASLGRLTAGMAHEMNTPLAAVRAALGELTKLVSEYRSSIDNAEVTPADHREIAKDMEAAAKLADSAAQKVAGFVRGIKAETRDLSSQEFCHFDPALVIEETLLLLDHAARAANCTITLRPDQPDLELFGSPSRLAQVVTNLVTNAIDASAEKGGGPIELVLGTWEGGVVLKVGDRGAGIAPDKVGKIFEPMYTSKPFGVGTGLGLTIVHDIVTGDFNGTIEVESRLGEGTSFVVKLGRASGETSAAPSRG
jgi:DNA-binding LacI/PurR family transcriptional regulator/signal transduction histidine kinase